MNTTYDVIIVGAGPSGSSCACNLKRFNPAISVLIIDKASFPRDKTCGGGISPEVLNYLDFDISEVVNYCCNDAVLVYGEKHISSAIDDVFMVRRDEFDHFLLKKAVERGVDSLLACEVVDVDNSSGLAKVRTEQGEFTAKWVIIAEGAKGKLARKLGIDPGNQILAAMEYEHYTDKIDGRLYINFDYHDDGYAWNFPKADGLSMGIGGFVKGRKKDKTGLPVKLRKFVGLFAIEEMEPKNVHGHPIQLYSGRKNLVQGSTLLIGEIAGCVDPLTAEGIRPAIKSGYLAAQLVSEALKNNKPGMLKKYNRVFHQHIGKDFQYARLLAWFINNYRKAILPYISTKAGLQHFMSVFSGKSTYREKISIRRIVRMVGKIIKFEK